MPVEKVTVTYLDALAIAEGVASGGKIARDVVEFIATLFEDETEMDRTGLEGRIVSDLGLSIVAPATERTEIVPPAPSVIRRAILRVKDDHVRLEAQTRNGVKMGCDVLHLGTRSYISLVPMKGTNEDEY